MPAEEIVISSNRVRAYCETDVGLKRDSNQDSFLIDEDLSLYIVADGMGGHNGGEVASSMAVTSVREYVKGQTSVIARDLLSAAYRNASNRIYDKSNFESPELSGMGTTMVVAILQNDQLYIGNVGDSRAYLLTEDQMWQLTEDHSLLNEQMRAGLITEEQSKYFAGRNVITRSVGFERDVECDILERELISGEKYVICSDGLSGMVTDQRICQIVKSLPPEQAVQQCIEEAKANGGDDNVTVMILEVL